MKWVGFYVFLHCHLYSPVRFVNKHAEQRQARGEEFFIRLAIIAVGSASLASAAAAERIVSARLTLRFNRQALADKIGGFL